MDIVTLINDEKNKGMFHKDAALLNVDPIATSVEITTRRALDNKNVSDPALLNYFYFTSNFAVYTVEKAKTGREEFLYFGKRDANPLFNNLEEACRQLLVGDNYSLAREEVKKVFDSVKSGQTHRTRLGALKLKEFNHEFAYFEIDTRYYWQTVKNGGLNKSQRDLAEKVFGEGNDFNRYMYFLTYRGIKKTRIYVLKPKYVQQHYKAGTAIARLCLLCDVYYSSNFYANIRGMDVADVLVGVLRLHDTHLEAACHKLLESPEETLAIMKTNPAMAAGLSDICKLYERRKK
ncbi:MAG: hypothetical protein NTX06_08420 [Proteobacteria bacterium]|nr:hypothetical protein [Pseudomonadota bacterium]